MYVAGKRPLALPGYWSLSVSRSACQTKLVGLWTWSTKWVAAERSEDNRSKQTLDFQLDLELPSQT